MRSCIGKHTTPHIKKRTRPCNGTGTGTAEHNTIGRVQATHRSPTSDATTRACISFIKDDRGSRGTGKLKFRIKKAVVSSRWSSLLGQASPTTRRSMLGPPRTSPRPQPGLEDRCSGGFITKKRRKKKRRKKEPQMVVLYLVDQHCKKMFGR